MIISELNDYYQCLLTKPDSPLTKDGYSKVNITYLIQLSINGDLLDIVPHTQTVIVKKNQKEVPTEMILPLRQSVPKIIGNFLEHRPLYIFGLDTEVKGEKFYYESKKSKESFASMKIENQCFSNMSGKVGKAINKFIEKWEPSKELQNPILAKIISSYNNVYYSFCVLDDDIYFANEDKEILEKWEDIFHNRENDGRDGYCCITGKRSIIARINNNLKGIAGGQPSGVNIVSCKSNSGESYGLTEGYVASISIDAMNNYTSAFNFLAESKHNKAMLGDMTILFWSKTNEQSIVYDDFFGFTSELLPSDGLIELDNTLKSGIQLFKQGILPDFDSLKINENTEFFVLGVKPNASRLSIKLFEKCCFGNMLKNLQKHIIDMQLEDGQSIPSLYWCLKETVSPKTKDKPNPALISAFMESILRGTMYPKSVFCSIISRIKTDQDEDKNKYIKINNTRVSMIKAYLNRKERIKGKGEFIKMALNEESKNEAYLCGRLFAILEKLQTDALGNVNAGLKSRFFGSACSAPLLVFPRLLKLAQNHIAKSDRGGYYESLISSIINNLENNFPKTLSIEEQGKFILGYYQQNKDLYKKKEN